jgi:hypothetical protein
LENKPNYLEAIRLKEEEGLSLLFPKEVQKRGQEYGRRLVKEIKK